MEMLASEYRIYAQDVLAFTVCLAALIWGGAPERIVASTWLILFELGGRVYRAFFSPGYQLADIDWFMATTDGLAAIVFFAVALNANRNYAMWIAAMQLVTMFAHVARGMAESILPIAYAIMAVAPGWFVLIFLAGGLVRHILRKRRYGEYRDWRLTPGSRPPSLTGDDTGPFAAMLASARGSWRDSLK